MKLDFTQIWLHVIMKDLKTNGPNEIESILRPPKIVVISVIFLYFYFFG
jgi:hypothetical protein